MRTTEHAEGTDDTERAGRDRRSRARRRNVGGAERVARLVGGLALVLTGIAIVAGLSPLAVEGLARFGGGAVALLAGLRMTWTGYTRYCHLNRRLGRDSYRG